MIRKLLAHLFTTVCFVLPSLGFAADSPRAPVWIINDGKQHTRNGDAFPGSIEIRGNGAGLIGTDISVSGDFYGIKVSRGGSLVLDGNSRVTSVVPPDYPTGPRYNDGQFGAIYLDDATATIGDGAVIEGGIAIVARKGSTVVIGKDSTLRSIGGRFNRRMGSPAVYLNNATAVIGAGTLIEGSTGLRLDSGSILELNGEEKSRITIKNSRQDAGILLSGGTAQAPNWVRGRYVDIAGGYGISLDTQAGYARLDLEDITINARVSGIDIRGRENIANLSKFAINVTAGHGIIFSGGVLTLKEGNIKASSQNPVNVSNRSAGLYIYDGTAYLDHVTIHADEGIRLSRTNPAGKSHVIVYNNSEIEGTYHAARLEAGAQLDVFDSVLKGRDGIAFRLDAAVDPQTVNRVNLTRSTLIASSTGFTVINGEAEVYLDNSTVRGVQSNNQFDNSLYSVNPDGRLMLVARNNSMLYGRGLINKARANAGTADVVLNDGSVWFIDGNSEVTNLTNNNALIVFVENKFEKDQGGYVKLQINGNYRGEHAVMVFDIATDENGNTLRDHVTVQGDAYGQTSVIVRNRSGLATLANQNSDSVIELIEVMGEAEHYASTFTGGDYTINGRNAFAAGAYTYFLQHRLKDNIHEWYLTLDEPAPIDPETPGDGGKTGRRLIYGAGVPLYETYAQVLQRLNGLPTLRQRVGERTYVDGVDTMVDGQGFWMRVEGSTGHFNAKHSRTGADYDPDVVKTQLGLDFTGLETQAGSLIGGIYVQYGHAKADVSSRFGYGDIRSDAYGFGATLTWYQDNGFYVDAQAQAQWFDSHIYSRSRGGEKGFDRYTVNGNRGAGYAFGLESGRKFALSRGWSVTPQVQLVYSHVDFDSFRDLIDAWIVNRDGDGLSGRLGIAFDHEIAWQADKGDWRNLGFYGIGNIYHEFLDGASISVSSVRFRHEEYRDWIGIGGGLRYGWGDDVYSLYGEMQTRTAFGNFGKSYDLKGTVGFKAKF